jgi:uncharacterized OB-fold protein
MTVTAYTKPLPHPSGLTQPFWDAVKRHELSIQQCKDCGRFAHPPKVACPNCLSTNYQWTPVSGRGTIYSFNVTHRPPVAAFAEDVPYVIGLVELDDAPGVRVLSNVVQIAPQDVRVGMRVKVIYEDATEEMSLFKFVPAD